MSDPINTKGLELIKEMLSPEAAEGMANQSPGTFAPEMGRFAINNIFGSYWARPGLSLRDRSLVTVSMLIAIRATQELNYHVPLAIKNGVTREELEEVIYHAAGYLGFPAATSARQLMVEILDGKKAPDYSHTILNK